MPRSRNGYMPLPVEASTSMRNLFINDMDIHTNYSSSMQSLQYDAPIKKSMLNMIRNPDKDLLTSTYNP